MAANNHYKLKSLDKPMQSFPCKSHTIVKNKIHESKTNTVTPNVVKNDHGKDVFPEAVIKSSVNILTLHDE